MLITRYAKIVMCLALAVFCLLVAYDNIADYGANYLFVQHVLSMDTTFPGNELMYRSITDPLVWQIAYALIIAAEGLTGVLFLPASFACGGRATPRAPTSIAPRLRHRRRPARLPRVVLRLHGGRRRVVRHVGVARPGTGRRPRSASM